MQVPWGVPLGSELLPDFTQTRFGSWAGVLRAWPRLDQRSVSHPQTAARTPALLSAMADRVPGGCATATWPTRPMSRARTRMRAGPFLRGMANHSFRAARARPLWTVAGIAPI